MKTKNLWTLFAASLLFIIAGCGGPASYQNGRQLYAQGKYTEAVESYKKAVQENPSFPQAYVELAYTYDRLGQRSLAIGALQQAIRHMPPG